MSLDESTIIAPFFLVRKREPVSEWCNIRKTGLVWTAFEEKMIT